MSLMSHTFEELNRLGMTEDATDEYNKSMRSHIIKMMNAFCEEGHSGFSAGYAVSILSKLMRYEPLTPIAGADDEWVDVAMYNADGGSLYQNKRYSKLFKEGKDGQAYNIEGKVFWEWCERPLDEDEEGYPGIKTYKSYYTNGDSRVEVTFPYTPTDPIYEERVSEAS